MAELVDATDSKSVSFTGVPVRVGPGAPLFLFSQALRNDPDTGVIFLADARFESAIECAKEHNLRLHGILGN